MIDTPEFQSWFGDSRVVDEAGRPLVVYHGTAADVTRFDAKRAGSNYITTGGQRGFFFTSSPNTASVYAEQAAGAYLNPERPEAASFGRGTANIMPVFLCLKNPLVINTRQSPDKYFDYNRDRIYRRIDDGRHDGLIVVGKGEFPRSLFMALDPTQIKSSISNSGRFDPADPDITDGSAHLGTRLVRKGLKP